MSNLKQKQQIAKVEIAEAIKQDARAFTDHLKLIANGGDAVAGIRLQVIMYGFKHSKAFNNLSTHYQNKVPQPHTCATMQGMIKMEREGNKPYTYKLLHDKKIFEARPYQQDIIQRTSKADGSMLIELPTGGGKTYIAKEIAQNEINKGGKVLFVAPRTVLITQTVETFIEFDPQIIHGKQKYDSNHNVFVSTLQTAHKRKLGFDPTMVIVDESHIGHDGKMMKSLLGDFTGRVVALSATPYDKRGRPLQGFNNHIKDYDTSYMITHGYLVQPICYRPVRVDLKHIKVTAGDYNQEALDTKFNNIESVMQIVDATKQTVSARNHCITFCITIKHAQLMAEAFTDSGITAAAYHSELSRSDKISIMEDFKSGKVKMLTNPASLAEGFDFPTLDTLVIARPTKSQNRARQMVGRALRTAPNKTEAVVLDCSNMIDNTGLPTSPITPREDRDTPDSIPICKECDSMRVFRKVVDNTAYRVCAECGHEEELEGQEGYLCESCDKVHTKDSTFIVENEKLYLFCECGHSTVISEATSHDDLEAIFDHKLVERWKRTLVSKYLDYVVKLHGSAILFTPEIKAQIDSLNSYIDINPHLAHTMNVERSYLFSLEEISNLTKEEMEEDESDQVDTSGYQLFLDAVAATGRTFGSDFESRIIKRMQSSKSKYVQKSVVTRMNNLLEKGTPEAYMTKALLQFITWAESQGT